MRDFSVRVILIVATAASSVRASLPAQQREAAPPAENVRVIEIVSAVSADRIAADIRKLVSFGTRNTLSDTLSPIRGIGAARRWIKEEFERISTTCGGCLDVFYLSEVFGIRTGPSRQVRQQFPDSAIIDSVNVVNVVAIQRGTNDPNRMLVMSGDIDSRVSQGFNAVDSAPGANDNASGMAGTLEAARVLTQHRFSGSIVYLGLSGEEQGLFGGRTVAQHARQNGWNIVGVLNNDMIGNIEGISGVIENTTARVFSDPTPMSERVREEIDRTIAGVRSLALDPPNPQRNTSLETELERLRGLIEAPWQQMRRRGGEVDGASRQLARYVDKMADLYLPTLDVILVYRLDRFGRGGHHTPFANVGYPGVRIMESHENYNRQHQDIRVENGIRYGDVIEGVNFDYAAKLTALNAATLASLAGAPGPPTNVNIQGAVRPAATLQWDPPADRDNVAGYRVYWRMTDSSTWDRSVWVGVPPERNQPGRPVYEYRLAGLVIDNYYFGVASVAPDGSESTVVFPLP